MIVIITISTSNTCQYLLKINQRPCCYSLNTWHFCHTFFGQCSRAAATEDEDGMRNRNSWDHLKRKPMENPWVFVKLPWVSMFSAPISSNSVTFSAQKKPCPIEADVFKHLFCVPRFLGCFFGIEKNKQMLIIVIVSGDDGFVDPSVVLKQIMLSTPNK